jgi:hypothetical protein
MRGLEPPPNNGLESKPSAYTKFRHICLFYAPIAAVPVAFVREANNRNDRVE